MRLLLVTAALAAHALLMPAAHAAEPFKPYDAFSERPLDPARWQDSERSRVIKGGAMHLMQRTWGSDASDFNLTALNWNTPFAHPATINQMRARVTVNALETNACPTNSVVADSRARLIGGFFNIGTATPGSMLYDVIAQLRLVRFSNSSDAAGVLRVQGVASLCLSADCNSSTTLGNVVDLGTAAIGKATTVELQWDEAAKSFHFSRDSGAYAGTVGYSFAVSNPPGVPFRQMATRVNAPNCQSAPRVSGMIDAKFDNIFVNQSAQP